MYIKFMIIKATEKEITRAIYAAIQNSSGWYRSNAGTSWYIQPTKTQDGPSPTFKEE
jgi:hypothetical protein